MFVGVVALRYQHHITKCHHSHKHSPSPLTKLLRENKKWCFMYIYVQKFYFNDAIQR